jgi:glutamate-ammonia-ligase adenylyltransferase
MQDIPTQGRWPAPHDRERTAIALERWRSLGPASRDMADDSDGAALLGCLFGNSPYLAESALSEAAFLIEMWHQGADVMVDLLFAGLEGLRQEIAAAPAADRVGAALRRAKRRLALAVAVADIAGSWDLSRVTESLSRFASTATSVAVDALLLQLDRQGVLRLDGEPDRAGLTILGMGKLGAQELNYSSDIDLIVLYDRDAPAVAGDDALGTKFVRLTRQLVQMLSDVTADGYVFRTDLRLRPDPGSTPLAMSTIGAETYYESVGQNWERAAMIKARPVAGSLAVGEAFLRTLVPYIWRKHLDFAAIQDIHSIKRQIDVHRGGGRIAVHGHDVKLGRGGIREVEFFVQTQQLIFGGRRPELRLRGTRETLRALAAAGLITTKAAHEMEEAYVFLRRLEHRLQMVDDRQTHRLPDDDRGIAAIATFLGYPAAEPFVSDLLGVLRTVEGHYARLFEDSPGLGAAGGNLVFTGTEEDPATLETLRELGYREPAVASGIVRRWHHGRYRCTATARARELLTELMPTLLKALAASANPGQALLNFDRFLANLPAGVQLFSLFKANPALLELMTAVLGSAPRVGAHLARRPILLDAVLSPDFYAPYPDPGTLAADLRRALAATDNEQDLLDVARRWTNDQRLRIAVHQLKGIMTPEAACFAYADLAAAVVSEMTARVTADFEHLHGGFGAPRLAVVALGKLGSREMTVTSDLDLMFIYDVPAGTEHSDGVRPLAPIQYYTRLSQKIIVALTSLTNEGLLYEVDMRLRPSGNAGPLASSIDAFETYQRESAWTWEHLALTRARVLCGPRTIVERLEQAIRTPLCRERDPAQLLRDVADMRDRIAEHMKPRSVWDFKYIRGGLFDIDFCIQYLALREAPRQPGILHPNVTEMLPRLRQAGAIAEADAATLLATHRLFLSLQALMRLSLEGQEAAFDESEAPDGLKRLLASSADVADMAALKEKVQATAVASYDVYTRLVEQPAEALGFKKRSER